MNWEKDQYGISWTTPPNIQYKSWRWSTFQVWNGLTCILPPSPGFFTNMNRNMNILQQKASAAACRCQAVSSVISNHAVCLAGSLQVTASSVSTVAITQRFPTGVLQEFLNMQC